tara:strand:- start:233 stop:391 length:159 start_codon:yes stop_codon:yes gene_type:complete
MKKNKSRRSFLKKVTLGSATFGLRAAGAALLANESYYQGKPIDWDPNSMKLL